MQQSYAKVSGVFENLPPDVSSRSDRHERLAFSATVLCSSGNFHGTAGAGGRISLANTDQSPAQREVCARRIETHRQTDPSHLC